MIRRLIVPAFALALGTTALAAQENPQSPQPQTPQTPQSQPQAQNPTPAPAATQGVPRDTMQAQAGRQFAQRRLETLLQGITLTAAQRGKVDSVITRYAPELPAGSPENSTDSNLTQRWNLILPRIDNEVRVALTPDQQRVWDRNVEQLRTRRPGVGDR
jgi:Spy/CpxP family protein refolding chaperone